MNIGKKRAIEDERGGDVAGKARFREWEGILSARELRA
jgi:hypothetical protein